MQSKEVNKMLVRIIVPIFAASLAFALHMIASIYETVKSISSLDPSLNINYWGIYSSSLMNYTGFSIAIGILLFTYTVLKYLQLGIAGKRILTTGIMISCMLFLILSFSFGFYTVSIEEFYINKIGWFVVSVKKMLILPVTILSFIPGYTYIIVKTKKFK